MFKYELQFCILHYKNVFFIYNLNSNYNYNFRFEILLFILSLRKMMYIVKYGALLTVGVDLLYFLFYILCDDLLYIFIRLFPHNGFGDCGYNYLVYLVLHLVFYVHIPFSFFVPSL
jgi:hypothetical protein